MRTALPNATRPLPLGPSPTPSALIQVTPRKIDFGEIWSGEECESAVAVRNVSVSPVTIYYRPNCSGVPFRNGDRIEPGQTLRIPIKIDTTRRLGPINQTLTIYAVPGRSAPSIASSRLP